MFRIVYGSVSDSGENLATTYREGWWWVLDSLPTDDMPPYDPEGPFVSKQAATRHLIRHFATFGQVGAQFRGWDKQRILRRRTLRPVSKHIMLMKRLARREIFVRHGIAKLVALLHTFGECEDSDAREWLIRWLHNPLPCLGDHPINRMYTTEGQEQVAEVLAMIQSGVYA